MNLPVVLSVPHAGLVIPPEAQPYCHLGPEGIIRDSDPDAGEVFDLQEHVELFVSTDIAKSIVDLNRSAGDRRADGVVKTRTSWLTPVYETFPPESTLVQLIDQYYRPYHSRLSLAAASPRVKLGVDGHVMAAVGPPGARDAGMRRPLICLSDVGGTSLPEGWMDLLADCFRREFACDVAVNAPNRGVYLVFRHMDELPWVKVAFSSTPFASNADKTARLLKSLERFFRRSKRCLATHIRGDWWGECYRAAFTRTIHPN
jgi:formiminoglutamase